MSIEDYCDELDALLAASGEDSPSLDAVHGFMSAALCGPRVVSLSDCACALFLAEEEDAESSECELPEELLEMLGRLYEDTLGSIKDGSFLPIVACGSDDEAEAEDVDARQWCSGFLMGLEQNRSRWKLNNSQVLDLLTPIILLADPDEFEQAVAQVQEISADEFKQELLESLPGSVCEFKALFKKMPYSSGRTGRTSGPSAKKRRSPRR